MSEREFETKLTELIGRLGTLPEGERNQLEELAEQTRDRHQAMRKSLGDLQQALDHLRLSVKYLVFDLEATRRENEYLRRLIDTQGERE